MVWDYDIWVSGSLRNLLVYRIIVCGLGLTRKLVENGRGSCSSPFPSLMYTMSVNVGLRVSYLDTQGRQLTERTSS